MPAQFDSQIWPPGQRGIVLYAAAAVGAQQFGASKELGANVLRASGRRRSPGRLRLSPKSWRREP
jgi:hypothetical protein